MKEFKVIFEEKTMPRMQVFTACPRCGVGIFTPIQEEIVCPTCGYKGRIL